MTAATNQRNFSAMKPQDFLNQTEESVESVEADTPDEYNKAPVQRSTLRTSQQKHRIIDLSRDEDIPAF
jgi:hypothetical protein